MLKLFRHVRGHYGEEKLLDAIFAEHRPKVLIWLEAFRKVVTGRCVCREGE